MDATRDGVGSLPLLRCGNADGRLMFLLPGPVKDDSGEVISKGSGARLPLIALFIYLFAIFYSVGEGPVP